MATQEKNSEYFRQSFEKLKRALQKLREKFSRLQEQKEYEREE